MKKVKLLGKFFVLILSLVGILTLMRFFTFYFYEPRVTLSHYDKQWKAEVKNDVAKLSFAFGANWNEQSIIDEILVYFPEYIQPVTPRIYKISA